MKRKIIICILLSFFTSITFYGIYKLVAIVNEYKEGYTTYNNLKQYTNIDNETKLINQEEDDIKEEIQFPQVDFSSLEKINEDIVAWININNLHISYPVVQGDNNDYYLHHMVNRTYNSAGSIFMDYRNNNNLNDKHTIIYGHNMKDGTMFSKLLKYKTQKYYDENPYYLLITPNKNYKVEIISGYIANTNDTAWRISFSNEEDFNNWLNNTIDKSLFKSSITPKASDKIITLSTCSNDTKDTRFVLVGILKEY